MREGFHTYCLQTIASTTAQRYEREVLVVEGMMNLEYDTYNHFVSYYGTLKSSGYGDGTIHTIKSAIDKYLDFLIDQEVRDDNPSRLIELKKTSKQIQHHKLLSSEELDLLMQQIESKKSKNRFVKLLMLSLVRYQGLGAQEITNLKLGSLVNGKLEVEVNGDYVSNVYDLRGDQVGYWYEYLHYRREKLKEETDRLFINHMGKAMFKDGVKYLFDTLKEVIPSKLINATIVRQSSIAEHYRDTNDLIKTQRFARHRWASSTEKYIPQITEEMRKEVELKHPFNFL